MALKIVWSEFAEYQLDEIYEYYKKEASLVVAKRLLKGIVKTPNSLLKTPYLGQVEELLTHRKTSYRYLIFKNYKLIYSIDLEQNSIKISDVFDTRQNPIYIERIK